MGQSPSKIKITSKRRSRTSTTIFIDNRDLEISQSSLQRYRYSNSRQVKVVPKRLRRELENDRRGNTEHRLMFISHYKSEAAMEARYLKDAIFKKMNETYIVKDPHSIFLDSDNLSHLDELPREVRLSSNFLFILSKDVLDRPYCLIELKEAYQNGKNIIPVRIENESRGFSFEHAKLFGSSASTLPSAACKEELLKNGVDVGEVKPAVAALLKIIAVELPIGAHEKTLDAKHSEIIERMQIPPNIRRRGSLNLQRKRPTSFKYFTEKDELYHRSYI